MATPQRNLSARAGNTMRVEFRFRSGGPGGEADPDRPIFDLTGSVIRVFIRGRNGTPALVKSTADNTLTMVADEGIVTLKLTAAETRLLAAASNLTRYEIERLIGDEETTLLTGCIVIEPGINADE